MRTTSSKFTRGQAISGIVVCLLIGLLLGGFGVKFLLAASAQWGTFGWIATPATVLSSSVTSHYARGGSGHSISVAYEYTVNGRRLTSSTVSLTAPGGTETEMSDLLRSFPARGSVTAYVNPRNEAQAVLLQGGAGVRPLSVVVGVILLILGVAAVGAGWRMWAMKP